ncbi:MAG TPA: hypothetical protein DIC60_01225 [Lachnospiraceae bacterium]|nr:hypothetical protein [Lachnospiraceae bacterium]
MTLSPNFDRCEKFATSLLLKQKVFSSTQIKVTDLQFDYDIVFDTFSHYCQVTETPSYTFFLPGTMVFQDCLTIKRGSVYIILYNGRDNNYARRNWSIAHEIGHIYLGHKTDGPQEEIEANFFAAQLLMPEAVLRTIYYNNKRLNANDVHRYFYVSKPAAIKRIHTLNHKYFNSSEENEVLLERFRDAIEYICFNQSKILEVSFV